MPYLDPKPRCNRCGTRLPEARGDECPDCHAKLAEVGVCSGLSEWAERRRVGRPWFIGKHILTWVCILGAGAILASFLRGGTQPRAIYAINFATSLILGTCTGWLCWRTAEAEFKAAGFLGDEGFDRPD